MPCRFHQAGEVVNDAERHVLLLLRDELPEEWCVVGNFEVEVPGTRSYECDAIALSPDGYGYLIDTKGWKGPITGNDHTWSMPDAFDENRMWTRPAPIHILAKNVKRLSSLLKQNDRGRNLKIFSLVVVVDEHELELDEGSRSARDTVTDDGLIERLVIDPRTPEQAQSGNVPPDAAHEIYEFLTTHTRPKSRKTVGPYQLDELDEQREDGTSTWMATASTVPGTRYRLKMYPLDTIAPPEQRLDQLARAKRDFEALSQLDHTLVVQPLGVPFRDEDSLVVITDYPTGKSIQQISDEGELDQGLALEYVKQIFTVLGQIHLGGVVHRNLRPSCIWVDTSTAGSVRFSDFDVARIESQPGVTKYHDPDSLDAEFAAPEVLADLSSASEASDVYSAARISRRILQSVDEPTDAITEYEELLTKCISPEPTDRPEDAGTVAQEMAGAPSGVLRSLEPFEVGDTINDRYVVELVAAGGGLAQVYRLFDKVTKKIWGGKFPLPETPESVGPVAEFDHGQLPDHRNVVKVHDVAFCQSVLKRDSNTSVVYKKHFLLTEWVDGDQLRDFVDQGLPEARLAVIGAQLLSGIAHLSANGITHRDIKPENVLVEENTGRVVLIDFNVSTAHPSNTEVGTARYRDPWLPSNDWQWSQASDVYSAGICLLELLSGGQAKSRQEWLDWIDEGALRKNPTLLEILKEMIGSEPGSRPPAQTAGERLEAIAGENPPPRIEDPPDVPPVAIGNRYVHRLLKLYSQSSTSNAGTRGFADPFAKWLYVETDLDRHLVPDIIEGSKSLVVITGNAGDGKTVFLRRFEERLESEGARREPDLARNGSVITAGEHVFLTNWDGSQDAGENSNDEVLLDFFAPFAGCGETNPTSSETSVIAINEGRLLDFFNSHEEQFAQLRRYFDRLQTGDTDGVPDWIIVINLNRRSLTGPGDAALIPQLVRKLAADQLWSECDGCPAFDSCPSRSNAEMFRHPIIGQRAIGRIRELFDIVRLRGRLHITARDLVSAISYQLTGNRTCEELIESDGREDSLELLSGYAYNRLFAGAPGGDATNDRLLAELGTIDPASVSQPGADAALWMLRTGGLPLPQRDLPERDRNLIDLIAGAEPDLKVLRFLHASLKRKVFIESEDPDHLSMMPYEHLTEFLAALTAEPEMLNGLNSQIAEAISASGGFRSDPEDRVLGVRLVEDLSLQDRSYLTMSIDEFETSRVEDDATSLYFEHAPRLIRFASRNHKDLVLDVTLDIFEVLMRMRRGYTASSEDLRGSWLSLGAFKQRLASRSSNELRLQRRSGETIRIGIDEQSRIQARRVS